MDAKPRRPDAEIEALELAASLEARYGRLDAEAIIEICVTLTPPSRSAK